MSDIQMVEKDDGWYFVDQGGFLHGPYEKESVCYEEALEHRDKEKDEPPERLGRYLDDERYGN